MTSAATGRAGFAFVRLPTQRAGYSVPISITRTAVKRGCRPGRDGCARRVAPHGRDQHGGAGWRKSSPPSPCRRPPQQRPSQLRSRATCYGPGRIAARRHRCIVSNYIDRSLGDSRTPSGAIELASSPRRHVREQSSQYHPRHDTAARTARIPPRANPGRPFSFEYTTDASMSMIASAAARLLNRGPERHSSSHPEVRSAAQRRPSEVRREMINGGQRSFRTATGYPYDNKDPTG